MSETIQRFCNYPGITMPSWQSLVVNAFRLRDSGAISDEVVIALLDTNYTYGAKIFNAIQRRVYGVNSRKGSPIQ